MKFFLFLILVAFSTNYTFSQNISQREFTNLIKKTPDYVGKYLIFKGWKLDKNQRSNMTFKYTNLELLLDSTITLKKDNSILTSLEIEFLNVKVFDNFKSMSFTDQNFRKSFQENSEIRFISIDGTSELFLYSEIKDNELKYFASISKSTY